VLPRHLLACACLLPVACTGPFTVVHNPARHRVFVDGVEVPLPPPVEVAGAGAPDGAVRLPFHYYGTGRWDAMPADAGGLPDWSRQPASAPIELPPPVSLWLFPLDFPLELARRAVAGREDNEVRIELPATPPELFVPAEIAPSGLGQLVERAAAARVQR
jgi:hypothetical protein